MYISFLFIPFICLIGIITSWEDFKCNKIRNKWILWSYGFGLFVYLCLSILSFLGLWDFRVSYLKDVFINAVIAFLVGYLFWKFRVWSAGDAKLFAVFSFLLPLEFYAKGYLPYFPSFAFLVNIFIVAVLFFFLHSIVEFVSARNRLSGIDFKGKLLAKLKSSDWALSFRLFLAFVLFFVVMQVLGKVDLGARFNHPFIPFVLRAFSYILFLGLGYLLISKKEFSGILTVLLIVSVIGVLFACFLAWGGAFFLLQYKSFGSILLKILLIVFVGTAIGYHIKLKHTQIITVDKLKPGMIFTEEVEEKIKEDKKFFNSNIQKFYAEGLSQEQVEPVQEALRKHNMKEIMIYKKQSFAVLIFCGLLVTVFIKQNIVQYIQSVF